MKEIKWYISDDGTTKGTQAEVEAYEKALNPLAKFGFPWCITDGGSWVRADESYVWGRLDYNRQVTALLNLMPLVEELRQTFDREEPQNKAAANLLLAYEKALGIEQPS